MTDLHLSVRSKAYCKRYQDNQIKAEFYVLGNEVELYPEAARKIVRDGHDIQDPS